MIKQLSVRYKCLQDTLLITETPEGTLVKVQLNESQLNEYQNLVNHAYLEEGNHLHLLNLTKGLDSCQAEFIIFEPGYLVDISSLAECFKPYGAHSLNYILSHLQAREQTSPILLGNTANFFIDELINEEPEHPVEYIPAMKQMFRTSAFEFSSCEDLKDVQKEKAFFQNAAIHYNNIKHTVDRLLARANIDKDKLTVEPAFICGSLGLQGRLDIMQCDYSAFIELKSGKAVEDFRTGQFIHSAENHYTQMILYLAVLEFNLDVDTESVRSYLLYSKYPVLSKEQHSRKHLEKAIALRNNIVAREYAVQKQNVIAFTREMFNGLHSHKMNLKGMEGKLFHNYLAPQIDRFMQSFDLLDNTEQSYLLRLYNFILKELWYSKAGEREYEGVKQAANLWNSSFEEKTAAGEILFNLNIIDNRADRQEHTIRLAIPEYDDLYLPNFRQGDMIVLYERNGMNDTVNNRQVFKGSIQELNNQYLSIRLRAKQKNPEVWNSESFYAIEHDYTDTVTTNMLRALYYFSTANKERRDLLLCRRKPEAASFDYGAYSTMERSVRKALAADDCFLLVGPPGTGKTSIALKEMVKRLLTENKGNLLLVSYTNRAVDEICKAISEIEGNPSFIRVGSELNCDPLYKPYLLENHLRDCTNRKEVVETIDKHRIFVGTAASVWSKPELFQLKRFELAIIDEATQLLEPHLLGILTIKSPSGENAVKRFVLIGDHKQLPAVVLQREEESQVNEPELTAAGLQNLSDSLFERLYRKYKDWNAENAFDSLTHQGRMHPEIARFPSQHFYDGALQQAGLPHQQVIANDSSRLFFYDIKPVAGDCSDKSNLAEARKVIEICGSIAGSGESIGIITPFRKQIALIRSLLQTSPIQNPESILVDTVERFQGSQRDVIIYSFCIKTVNQLHALPKVIEENGNLIDRKLNVVLTRARKRLYIIGNEELIGNNQLYRKLIRHIQSG